MPNIIRYFIVIIIIFLGQIFVFIKKSSIILFIKIKDDTMYEANDYEMLSPYLRGLYFLTNVHIFQKSLRKHKYRHHFAQIEEWLQKLEERKMTHREAVCKSRTEATSRISKLRAERMLNAKTDLELVATQFSQPSSQSPS